MLRTQKENTKKDAEGQNEGVKSYDRMVDLIVEYRKHGGKIPKNKIS